jgi:hypothetical protein
MAKTKSPNAHPVSSRIAIAAGIALLVGVAGNVAASEGDANTSCRQETRRVVVRPKGGAPKAPRYGRFEERQVTVCDGKVVSREPSDVMLRASEHGK